MTGDRCGNNTWLPVSPPLVSHFGRDVLQAVLPDCVSLIMIHCIDLKGRTSRGKPACLSKDNKGGCWKIKAKSTISVMLEWILGGSNSNSSNSSNNDNNKKAW